MKKALLIIVIVLLTFVLVLFTFPKKSGKNSTGLSPENGAQIANPASVYCVDQGGKLEIRESTTGQYGVCVFSDGRECEEWQFYNLKVCQ